ncbi:hypothetical protein [Paraclostridium bifermentans]|uniref:hypothetical protein n=1 Tax=Paraclostridium bifermentans TaxID=1490 RepID=UPI00359CA2E3
MKKNIIKLGIVLGILLIAVLWIMGVIPPDSRSYHHTVTKSTDLSNENVDGLYLGDRFNSEKVISKYGEMHIKSSDVDDYDYYCLSKNIEVATKKDDYNIVRFCVNNETLKTKMKTEKGVSFGDSKEKVIKLYGENYYNRIEQGLDIIGYVDKEQDCSIEFWLSEEGVCYIRLDYNYMI